MQRQAIEQAAHQRGDRIAVWYAETASGGTMRRTELARMREDVRAGRVARLYVYRLDRLSRTGIRDTAALVDELRAAGVELVTLADGFDVAGPAADIVLAVLAWAAKMERLAIAERLRGARERVEAEGRRWGRPRRMTDDQVTRARELAAGGKSVRAIAVTLRVPRPTVARALRRNSLGETTVSKTPPSANSQKPRPRGRHPPPSR